MTQQLADAGLLPDLTYHFGLRREHLEVMPRADIRSYVRRLRDLPPPGCVFLATRTS